MRHRHEPGARAVRQGRPGLLERPARSVVSVDSRRSGRQLCPQARSDEGGPPIPRPRGPPAARPRAPRGDHRRADARHVHVVCAETRPRRDREPARHRGARRGRPARRRCPDRPRCRRRRPTPRRLRRRQCGGDGVTLQPRRGVDAHAPGSHRRPTASRSAPSDAGRTDGHDVHRVGRPLRQSQPDLERGPIGVRRSNGHARRRHRSTSRRRRSRSAEHHAEAALGIRPADRPLLVAHEVARAAFEALLVVEEDASVGRRHEQPRRAGDDARAGAAVAADRCVDDDVGSLVHVEPRRRDDVVEVDARTRSPERPPTGDGVPERDRDGGSRAACARWRGSVAARASAAGCRRGTSARPTDATSCGYRCCTRSDSTSSGARRSLR